MDDFVFTFSFQLKKLKIYNNQDERDDTQIDEQIPSNIDETVTLYKISSYNFLCFSVVEETHFWCREFAEEIIKW